MDLQQTFDQSRYESPMSVVDLGLPVSMRTRTWFAIDFVIPLIPAEMQCSSTTPLSTMTFRWHLILIRQISSLLTTGGFLRDVIT